MFCYKENIHGKIFQTSLPVYIFLFFLLLSCYRNTFHAEWHFDDFPNIVSNTPLHLTDLSNDSLKQTFFAYPGNTGRLLRPVSNFSFALNWFFGQDKVFGYHVVNFTIHFLASLFLYQTCILLLSSPRFEQKYQDSRFFIAALAAILWAVNPIQTQAVTYIVQRMASLAALFSIISIWFYLKARIEPQQNIFYLGAFIAFLLAIGSKENAVILPASLILIEMIFFQRKSHCNKKILILSLSAIGLILLFTLMLGGFNFFSNIFQPYQNRTFTMWERLLTQPRVLLFYMSLLLYPSPLRLSIEHDILVSISFFSPYTTFPAILFIGCLVITPLFLYKRYPLFSFSMLFFLLNHSMESSILNLELIFEHRNYLPSFFFFLPIAATIHTGIERYSKKSMVIILYSGTVGLILLLAFATYLRNTVWLTDADLWMDALNKAPKSSRPYINIAAHLQHRGNNEKAFELFQMSMNKYSQNSWIDRVKANNGMAYSMMSIGQYDQASTFFEQAAQIAEKKSKSTYSVAIFQQAKMLWLMGRHEEDFDIVADLVNDNPKDGRYIQVYAEMLILMDRHEEALAMLQKVLALPDVQSIEYHMALLDLSLVYTKMGMHEKADLYIRLAQAAGSPRVQTLLVLLYHSIRADKQEQAKQAFTQLLELFTWPNLMVRLERPHPDYPTLPLSYPLMQEYAAQWLAVQKQLP